MAYQKGEGKSVVIALGGNALGNTPQEQLELVKNTAEHIVDMVAEGINVVVSHGNGPQVGMINNAFDYASTHDGKTPAMPFPECGAMSQGYIGYQLSQAILNDMKRRGIMRSTACVVTQTVVYPEDPAFQNPTKPVGAFLTEEEAMQARRGDRLHLQGRRRPRLAPGGGRPRSRSALWSSTPSRISWTTATSSSPRVAAAFRSSRSDDSYHGVPAVIDKDRSSAKLAADFKADMLVILTAVEKVCINFNTPRAAGAQLHDGRRGLRSTSRRASSRPAAMLPKVRGLHRVRAGSIPRARRSSPRSSALPTA